MPTLVERTKQVVSAEADDFFQADTILYYLNKSQRKVTSYMVNQETIEKEPVKRKTLRALDKLRKFSDISVNGLTITPVDDYYKVDIPFPTVSGTEINQFLYLKYGDRTVLRELNTSELIRLDWGNLKPSIFESYYYVTQNASDEIVFETYLYEDQSGAGAGAPNVRVHYVTNPTDLTLMDESLNELPDQLENAVIYGAALMMIMQETVGEQNSLAIQSFTGLYQEEIQANTY